MKRKKTKKRLAFHWQWPVISAEVRYWMLGIGLFAAMGGSLAWAAEELTDPATLPLRVVRIEGEFQHLNRQQLERAVADQVRAGFFNVDVDAVRAAAETLPWVDQVRIRRVWPDTLRMEVTEQIALARWGKDGLINTKGQVFHPDKSTFPAGLPQLSGPKGAALGITLGHRKLSQALAPLDLSITQLKLDARGAWSMQLSNGVQVQLGSADLDQRVRRFVQFYPRLEKLQEGVLLQVDLRYTNGIAVRQTPVAASEPETSRMHQVLPTWLVLLQHDIDGVLVSEVGSSRRSV